MNESEDKCFRDPKFTGTASQTETLKKTVSIEKI